MLKKFAKKLIILEILFTLFAISGYLVLLRLAPTCPPCGKFCPPTGCLGIRENFFSDFTFKFTVLIPAGASLILFTFYQIIARVINKK